MYLYTLSFARGWSLQLSAGACGIDCECIFLAFHPCLFSLVAILIQESYVLSFAHVLTVGHGLAESATGVQLNFGQRILALVGLRCPLMPKLTNRRIEKPDVHIVAARRLLLRHYAAPSTEVPL